METPAALQPGRNAARTRAEILDVATAEFARQGFAGARVDEIAALTRCTKRMIYYYFGSKRQLYVAVLEQAFAALRPDATIPNTTPDPNGTDPLALIRQIAELTHARYRANPDFIRLLIAENVYGGTHLAATQVLATLASAEIDVLERALADGAASGVIRPGISACDVLTIIGSLCQFGVANRHTFEKLCGQDLLDPAAGDGGRRLVTDVVTAYLVPPSGST
jgi:AcrR family transcriptional regulator